jgi:hypothetical protein
MANSEDTDLAVDTPLVARDEHHKSTVNALSHTPDTTQQFP